MSPDRRSIFRIAMVGCAIAMADWRTASGQAPNGFPDVQLAGVTVQQGPPGPQPAMPGPPQPVAPPPAQPEAVQPADPIIAEPGVVFGPRIVSPDSFHPLFRLHQTIADVVGDNGELTTLGGFFPHPSDFGLWFFDGQFDILEDAHNLGQQTLNFAANLGLGWRWLDPSDGQVYGLSAWYDTDRSHPEFVHQVSVGAEVLGEIWDWRTNGYFPVGTNREALSFNSAGPTLDTRLASLTGCDIECGRRLPGWLGETGGVSAYGGWYYYRADRTLNTFGASLRLEAILSDNFSVEAKMSSDKLFGTNLAFGITWMLPAAGKCKKCQPPSLDYYELVQPVQRNRTIVFGRQP
jgi:hypothetical protein